MMIVVLVVVGLVSYVELKVDLFPNVDIPVISITTIYPGVAPETVETEVTRRIEEAINPIGGIKSVSSTTTEGLSSVVVEFQLEKNITTALQEVQNKINTIRREFPQDVEEPILQQIRLEDLPILSIAVLSPNMDAKTLTTISEKMIKRRLENISGVGQVRLVGASRREVQLLLDRVQLESYGLTYAQVMMAMQRENLDVPAGKLEQGARQSLVRVAGRIKDVRDFANIIVAEKDGYPIRLSSIARLEDGIEEQTSFALLDGKPALALEIQKQTGSNTVDVADNVKKALTELQKQLPGGVELRMVRDNSLFIVESVNDVKVTLVLGALLTVLVVFLFLNSWRSTVITGLTLPVSVISAFTIMNALGFTVNVLTLMGLSLAIGMLIDDAIVVRENIVRHMEHGKDHMKAAMEGTTEIGLAVMATTFTIMGVFVPVAFMGGIVGRFFYQFGMTVGFAVLVSLFVSFTLDPMLSSRWYDPAVEMHRSRRGLGRLLQRANESLLKVQDALARLLGLALRHRLVTVVLAIAAIALSMWVGSGIGSDFFPSYDREEMQVTFEAPSGTTLKETTAVAHKLDAMLKRHPEVAYTFSTIGTGTQSVNQGGIYVKLTPKDQREKTDLDLRAEIRKDLAGWPGLQTSVGEATEMGGGGLPLQVSVRGTDFDAISRVATRVLENIKKTPGAIDADTSLEDPRPEVRVRLDRKAASDLGLDLGTVASTVRGLVNGEVVSSYQDADGDAYDVRLRLGESQRRLREDLAEIYVPVVNLMGMAAIDPRLSSLPPSVPLSQVAQLEDSEAPSRILRRNLMREIRVMASTQGRSFGQVANDVKKLNAGIQLPPGVTLTYPGESEDLAEMFYYMIRALVLAVIFIYAILASQFRSFFHPLAIMLSLPLSLLGVVLALWGTSDTFNMMSMIGIIMLMGLVTKNAILLVDYANRMQREGETRTSALITAARIRFRPIVMTTLAMIFGMLPLAFEIGSGSEIRAPMARAVIGGLITSTLLTLVMVPVVYTFFDDWAKGLRGWWHRGVPVDMLVSEESVAPVEETPALAEK